MAALRSFSSLDEHNAWLAQRSGYNEDKSYGKEWQADYLKDRARQGAKGYQIGAADTRYRDYMDRNPYELDASGKRTLYDRGTKGSRGYKAAGTKLSKSQRKNYSKMAKSWEKKYGGRYAKVDQDYNARLDKLRQSGMQQNGMPVDIVDGKARYNLDIVSQQLKMTPQERQMVDTWGKAKTQGWREIGLSYKDYKKLSEKVQGASTKNKSRYAMYDNFANLDPVYSKLDLNKDAMAARMGKLDFARKAGGVYNMNMDKNLKQDFKPGWADKYGIPAMKAVWLGAASVINPFVGAAAATALNAAESSQAGNFSWGDVAKNAAVNTAGAYIGASGAGAIGQAAMRSGLSAGVDLMEGDFDTKEALVNTAKNVGGAAVADLGMSALKGGMAGYQSGEGIMAGAAEGLRESELGGYAQSLGLLSPMESAMDADMFAGVTEADFIDPNEMTMEEREKFMGAGEMYSPGGSMYVPGIEFVGIEPGQVMPGNIQGAPLDEELMGQGGQMTAAYGDNTLWGGGLGVNASPEAIAKWNADHGNIQADDAGIMPDEAGIGWEDALPFLAGLTPTIANLLSGSQRKRGTGGSGEVEVEDEGIMGFEDLYNQGAGSNDPYSTQQMFGAGIQ